VSAAIDRDLRARLEAAAGGAVRDLEPPCTLPGASLPVAIEPRDADSLGAALAVLDAARVPAAILGAGTKAWLGNPLRGARLLISTLGLAGIDELDEADGVVRVGAGTSLEALAAAARTAGWASPIDAPGRGGTVGGALASALAGPRRPGFGPARDAVLGLDTVLAHGALTRCGARVVKNVTGYDLAKLYVGSLGTLGVIERAWLRLRVVPERAHVLHAALDDDGAIDFALVVARRPTARAVALVSESLAAAAPGLGDPPRGGARWRLVVELAGDAVAVERDAAWLGAERKAEQAPDAAIEALRGLQTHVAPIGVRVRLHVLPSALASTGAVLERGGARLLVQPVPGVVTACFEAGMDDGEDPWWLDRVLGVVDEARTAARGEAVVEALPAWAQGRRDVFGGASGLSLMRSLKRRFDPNGILNPGRFAGAI
jgi:glycolate oxidase FAD binding subunit